MARGSKAWQAATGKVWCAFFVIALAGCASNRSKGTDPFFGVPSPGATAPAAGIPRPNPVASATPASSSSSSSTAAMAGGARQPATPTGWQGQRITPVAAASTTNAVPTPPPPPATPVSSRAPIPFRSGTVNSYDQAQRLLAGYGVKWQRLETWGNNGEWKFSCSIPRRQNPAISRTYEARAGNYLAAVQAVLSQIDKEKP